MDHIGSGLYHTAICHVTWNSYFKSPVLDDISIPIGLGHGSHTSIAGSIGLMISPMTMTLEQLGMVSGTNEGSHDRLVR